MTTLELNILSKRIHELNKKWWSDLETGEEIVRNKYELLQLTLSEIAEAMEGERKNLMDDHLPHRKMAEVEMADAAIRLFDFAGGFKYYLFAVEFHFKEAYKPQQLFFISEQIVRISKSESCSGQHISIAIAMIEYYCTINGYDLYSAIEEKLMYNITRQDHTHEARKSANGKKF